MDAHHDETTLIFDDDDPTLLVFHFLCQRLSGCGDSACQQRACLTYRMRTSLTPYRPPTMLAARSMALATAKLPNATNFKCKNLTFLDLLGRSFSSNLDPASVEQRIFATDVMNDLFDQEAFLERLRNGAHVAVHPRPQTQLQLQRRMQKPLWPLPHISSPAKIWLLLVDRVRQSDPPVYLTSMAKQLLAPLGYEPPSAHYEAMVMRGVCLLRMQRAIESADFHYDLVHRPPEYFLDQKIGALSLWQELQSDLGLTVLPSRIGLHTIVRRWLALQASRLAPFYSMCEQLPRLLERQVQHPLRVQWLSLGEEGVDQGGVAQEFFQQAALEAFGPPLSLFMHTDETAALYWINPAAVDRHRLDVFTTFGILIGLAIYNGFILPLQFPTLFYAKLLGSTDAAYLDTILEAWPMLYKSLQSLLDNPAADIAAPFHFSIGAPYTLPLDSDSLHQDEFDRLNTDSAYTRIEVPMTSRYGRAVSHWNAPWNSAAVEHFSDTQTVQEDPEYNRDVTDANKHVFVERYVKWLTEFTVREQFIALKKGLNIVLSPNLLGVVSASGLRLLVEGDARIDVDKLQQNVQIKDCKPGESIIQRFWRQLRSWNVEQVRKMLKFITGTDRLPIHVDARRKPPFIIRLNDYTENLPSASTCSRELSLPRYESEDRLQWALQWVLDSPLSFGKI